ncbi:hypothetical protein SDC9_89302 [bioreactor metagenome]|uniref:Uncharacterized protein n=1 Tax=bioreactor metagenome TaxID=1076179 RepID=A0A644ZNZ6_9ZZZZ
MVFQEVRSPAGFLEGVLAFEYQFLQFLRLPIGFAEPFAAVLHIDIRIVEIEDHVEIAAFPDVLVKLIISHTGRFANRNAWIIVECFLVQFRQEISNSRAVPPLVLHAGQPIGAIGWRIAVILILFDEGDGVDAETGNAFFQPPIDHRVNFLAQGWIFPIQIRLPFVEGMEIVIVFFSRNFFPDAASEDGAPVVRRVSVLAFSEYIIIPIFAFWFAQSLLEPGMFIRSMVHDQIQDDADVTLFGFIQQFLKISHRTELGLDPLVIGNVIAIVYHRRSEDRTDPQHRDPQFLQVRQFLRDAFDIAAAVDIAVVKTFRVNLIDDILFPPLLLFHVFAVRSFPDCFFHADSSVCGIDTTFLFFENPPKRIPV